MGREPIRLGHLLPEGQAVTQYICPQCEADTPTLNEGCCEDCRHSNQQELDLHNAEFDRWEKLSGAQRDAEIRDAMRRLA